MKNNFCKYFVNFVEFLLLYQTKSLLFN